MGNGATYLESLELHGEGVLNGLELRRDDGKNRGVDSVEFVEATPSTALTQPRKVLTDRLKEEKGSGDEKRKRTSGGLAVR